MAGQEGATLRQCDRVGENAVDVGDGGAGDGDKVVADAEQGFALDADVVIEEEIEVLGDRAGEGVFNGDYGSVDQAI
jgi:hypothetical protein